MKVSVRVLRYAVRNGESSLFRTYSRRVRGWRKNVSPVPPHHLEMLRWAIFNNAYESKWDTYGMYRTWIEKDLLIPC